MPYPMCPQAISRPWSQLQLPSRPLFPLPTIRWIPPASFSFHSHCHCRTRPPSLAPSHSVPSSIFLIMVCARIRLLRRTHYPQNKGWAFCKTHRPLSIWTLSFYPTSLVNWNAVFPWTCGSLHSAFPSPTVCFLCSKDHATGRLLFILQDSGKCLLLSEPSQVLSRRRGCVCTKL